MQEQKKCRNQGKGKSDGGERRNRNNQESWSDDSPPLVAQCVGVLLGLVAWQRPRQDSLDGGKLQVSGLCNGQAVKGRAHDVAKLGPKVTPVRVGVTAALLDIVAVLKRPRHGVT